jgi:Tol biopolymer transport system component
MRSIILAVLALALLAAPAQATYAGKNGRIVVSSNRTGSWQLHSVNADGGGITQITSLPEVDPGSFGNAFMPDVSPDGRRIVFSHDVEGSGQLYVVNIDGTGLTQLTDEPGRFHGAAHWAPDGKSIVFVRDTATTHVGVITTMAATPGAPMRSLTTDVIWGSFWPQYTPDGRRIMFFSSLGGLVSAIWIMDADGSHQRRLTAAPIEAGFSDLSPDGRRVLFINHQNTSLPTSIFRMKLDGSSITRLTNAGPLHDVQPVYSPDGAKIAFVSDRRSPAGEHDQDLYVMRADGTHITRIATGLTVGGCPDDDNCVNPDWGAAL